MKKFLSILTVLLFVFAFGAIKKASAAASVITPATADITSDSYGDGDSVAVPNIVIDEDAAADIKAGLIILTAPTGYKFDITSVADIAYTGTDLAGSATVSFVGETMMTFTITDVSSVAGDVTIGGVTPIKVKVTADKPMASAGDIKMSGTITGLDGSSNFGTLTQVAGAEHHLSIASENTGTEVAGVGFWTDITLEDQFGNTIDYTATDKTCTFYTTASPETTANKPEYNSIDLTWNSENSRWGGTTGAAIDFVAGVARTLDFAIYTAGESKTINFSCTASGAAKLGELTIDVDPAAKDKVLISSVEPTIGYIYQNISPTIVATLYDAYGNVKTDAVTAGGAADIVLSAYTDSGCIVTPADPALTGTLTVTPTAGVATFTDVKYNTINTTGIYIRVAQDLDDSGTILEGTPKEYDCTSLVKFYSNAGQTTTSYSSTETTTTTAPQAVTTTTAPETTTTTTSANVIPQPEKPIAEMNQAEKNTYTMQLQQFLIQLLTQLLSLLAK